MVCAIFVQDNSYQHKPLGVLRLKKHKEKGTRRVLQRNSSTGKINLVRFLLDLCTANEFNVFCRISTFTQD